MTGSKVRIEINHAWCKGCYLCISVCPRQVLGISREGWTGSHYPVVVRDIERCTACRNCEMYCPDLAIEVIEELPASAEEPLESVEEER
ncbi:MAG: 4Fe-4S binding protein [Anaerolineae bacterium]|nr:4Fe-4S binding protein [Anaerolineae bacterium]